MNPHLLCVGGEDHFLRIPFMLAVQSRGFRVSAAGTGDGGPFTTAGIAYHRFRFERFLNPLADYASIKQLEKLIADLRPDLVQSFDTKPNMVVPLAARRASDIRVIRTINGMGWVYSSRSPLAMALRPVQRTLHRLAAASTTATVFQNREDQALFRRHGMSKGGDSRLIPGSGIDVEKFQRDLATGAPAPVLREEFGLGDAQVVLTVTRLTRQKGVPTLLRAAALVHAACPSVRFLLVGPRESEGKLAISQAELDHHKPYVMAIGPRRDVPALLRLADVFAFPTEYREGVPRVLLEAGLARVPIVTTRMPGCCDIVRDGWSGLLVPARDPHLLAARIMDLLEDRTAAAALADHAASLVAEEFGLELTVTRYCDLYGHLLQTGSLSNTRRGRRPTPLTQAAAPGGPVLPLHGRS